jgi:TolB-like protein
MDAEKPAIPNAWKIATIVSFVIIIGLVTYNIVAGTRGLRPGDIQSLSILPFNNFTGDEQLDWAAAGMQSSLIGDMGRVSGLRVPGITTSNAYKETDLTATAIAEELNVDALVEGTLTCYGDMVCIQFRAISTFPEEKQLWVEDYMVDKSEILNLYSRIIQKMALEMKINLTPQGETWLAETRRVAPKAYDAYLQGRILLDQFNPASFHAAVDSFKKANALEPEWALLPMQELHRLDLA